MNFDEIYNKYYKRVLNFITFKTYNNFSISEELANDAFMKIFNHLDSYDSKKSELKTWIFTIVNRVLIDYFRKVKFNTISLNNDKDENFKYSVDYLLGKALVCTTTPHLEMVSKETMMQAQKAIFNLPKKLKRVSNLFFNHNYKMIDIAKMTKKPLNTVKGDIHKARKVLQKQLIKI